MSARYYFIFLPTQSHRHYVKKITDAMSADANSGRRIGNTQKNCTENQLGVKIKNY
jgi:hypothetical protein